MPDRDGRPPAPVPQVAVGSEAPGRRPVARTSCGPRPQPPGPWRTIVRTRGCRTWLRGRGRTRHKASPEYAPWRSGWPGRLKESTCSGRSTASGRRRRGLGVSQHGQHRIAPGAVHKLPLTAQSRRVRRTWSAPCTAWGTGPRPPSPGHGLSAPLQATPSSAGALGVAAKLNPQTMGFQGMGVNASSMCCSRRT